MNRKNKTYKVVSELKEILRVSKLETANFSQIRPEGVPYPTNEKEVDEFIKDRIKLHYRSWIGEPIERILKLLENSEVKIYSDKIDF